MHKHKHVKGRLLYGMSQAVKWQAPRSRGFFSSSVEGEGKSARVSGDFSKAGGGRPDALAGGGDIGLWWVGSRGGRGWVG